MPVSAADIGSGLGVRYDSGFHVFHQTEIFSSRIRFSNANASSHSSAT